VAGADRDGALHHARAVAADGTPGARRLAAALVRHLARGEGDVYSDPTAFRRFIEGGGNVALYAAAARALADVHGRDRPRSVLDLGCGDGRLTTAAVRPGLERIDVVEPSADLLAAARARLTDGGATVVAHGTTAQAFVDGAPADRWDVAQSTFALHALPPSERAPVLAFLAGRVRRLLIVEFDVPAFVDRSADHARYAAERYEAGMAEYVGDDVVVDGFLVPVLVGQFDPDRPRHTWEQPVAAWAADLRAAGFAGVRHRLLSDYWWAPAYLIEATGRAGVTRSCAARTGG
jgi:SAM-dependent methyltransferase